MVALFVLTIIFVYMDPVVEDNIHAEMKERVTGEAASNLLDTYLNSWHMWVPLFLAAIFLYVVSAGGGDGQTVPNY